MLLCWFGRSIARRKRGLAEDDGGRNSRDGSGMSAEDLYRLLPPIGEEFGNVGVVDRERDTG